MGRFRSLVQGGFFPRVTVFQRRARVLVFRCGVCWGLMMGICTAVGTGG